MATKSIIYTHIHLCWRNYDLSLELSSSLVKRSHLRKLVDILNRFTKCMTAMLKRYDAPFQLDLTHFRSKRKSGKAHCHFHWQPLCYFMCFHRQQRHIYSQYLVKTCIILCSQLFVFHYAAAWQNAAARSHSHA